MTMLIVTNQTDYTADFLILALKRRGIDFVRLNTEDFPQHVELTTEFTTEGVTGTIRVPQRVLDLASITSIWYRRPAPSVVADSIVDEQSRDFAQAECSEALDGLWRILPTFWVSHPDQLRTAESKMLQLAAAARLGFTIPHTLVSNSPRAALTFYSNRKGDLIYKPLRYGQLVHDEKNHLIFTSVIDEQRAVRLDSVQYAPVILQPYIPKKTELRVTVVGSHVFTVEIHSQEVPEAQQRSLPLT